MFRWLIGGNKKKHPKYKLEEMMNGQFRIRVLRKGYETDKFLTLSGMGYHHPEGWEHYDKCLGTREEAEMVIGAYMVKDE